MYAIIADSGSQFRVAEGEQFLIDRREIEPGEPIDFDRVLLLSDETSGTTIGQPTVAGAKVEAVVVDQVKGRKIHVGKYKRRKNYRLHKGHRQQYTLVEVTRIVAGS